MIWCDKIKDYVDQEKECIICVFYKKKEDFCFYLNWYPGLIEGRNE